MEKKFRHILRYGTHAEKDYFLDGFADDDFYSSFILNGNMVAYSPGAMSTFVMTLKKPFLIDPQTHAFQHGVEYMLGKKGEPKSSIVKLSNALGDPVTTVISERRTVTKEDFNQVDKLEKFVKSVISFQRETIKEKILSTEDVEYVNYALKDHSNKLSKDNLIPAGIIAPYFYMNNVLISDWLDINKNLIEITSRTLNEDPENSLPVFAQLVISRDLLNDSEKRKRVISDYSTLSTEFVLIWLDGFNECQADEAELVNFIELVQGLSAAGKKVFNLYGGYFSILMTKITNGLSGVCHGLEYGESRAVVPVGGGIPMAKYYFPPLHKRLKYVDFVKIILNKKWQAGKQNEEFLAEVCSCDQCSDIEKFGLSVTKVINKKGVKREFPTMEAKDHSLRHYLFNKKLEFSDAASVDLSVLLERLEKSHTDYLAILGKPEVEHLLKWKKVLAQYAASPQAVV